MASFGLLFFGFTILFSKLSFLLTQLRPKGKSVVLNEAEWKKLDHSNQLREAKVCQQIIFGPAGFKWRRKVGVPSILEDFVFGNKVRFLEDGFILEKWNTQDPKEMPDFEIYLYDPDRDSQRFLTPIKSYDWHVSEKIDKELYFKWFDRTQGGKVKVAI